MIRDLELWENLPKFSESIKIDDMAENMAENSAKAIFSSEVSLPYTLIIFDFDAPVYVANYTLSISRNIVYRLEGHNDGYTFLGGGMLVDYSFQSSYIHIS